MKIIQAYSSLHLIIQKSNTGLRLLLVGYDEPSLKKLKVLFEHRVKWQLFWSGANEN
jgi:hypothetical protein